ncbi:hypothetical protein AMS68_000685 [Peltaster fructicola]|uniref:Uncharacterized protein n=1 Tax=Peltaster fructicola TaxID=286661 RepID=A0A6H0XKK7_9PEZI|nr:hypothetical protein AMS68_000685 [Peltaster fructicola]
MQKVKVHDDDNRSGSGGSDLSNLEDTDTLGRAILRHEKDARRIQNLLRGAQGDLDRPTSRSALSSRLRSREPRAIETIPHLTRDVEIKTAFEVEPALNVPQGWARKTRPARDWTRSSKIPVSAEALEIDVASTKTTTLRRHNAPSDVQDDQHISVEDTPPSMRRRRPLARPTSLRTMNSRLSEIIKANKEDFSDLSLLASTPANTEHKSGGVDQAVRMKIVSRSTIPRTSRPAVHSKEKELHIDDDFDSTSDKENAPQQLRGREPLQPLPVKDTDIRMLHQRQQPVGDGQKPIGDLVDVATHTSRLPRSGMLEPMQQKTASKDAPFEPPTPMVTGGWIDTPKINKQSDAPNRPDNENSSPAMKDIMAPATKPEPAPERRTDSVAGDVITQAKDDSKLGKPSTRSMQETTSSDDQLQITEDPKRTIKTTEEDHVVLGKSTSTDQQEHRAREALNKHIIKAVISQQDAQTVSGSKCSSSSIKPGISKLSNPRNVTLTSNGELVCDSCGRMYTGVWRGLWIEFRSNFWLRDPTKLTGIRLTRLGAILFTWLCWYILELTLCAQYCQPRYAYKMVGYGVNPDAPVFPFVIPTLLFRPFRPAWRPALKWLSWAANVVLNWIMGVEPQVRSYARPARQTVSEHSRHAYHTIRQPARWAQTAATIATTSSRRAVESAIDAVDDIGRMW